MFVRMTFREGFLFRNSSFQPNEMVFTICNSISRTYFRLMREIGKVQQIIRKLPRSFAQNGIDWSTNCERIFQKPLFHFTLNEISRFVGWIVGTLIVCEGIYGFLWLSLYPTQVRNLKKFKYLAFIAVNKSSNQMVSISAWLQTLKNLNCKLHVCLSFVSFCSEPFNLKRSSFPL